MLLRSTSGLRERYPTWRSQQIRALHRISSGSGRPERGAEEECSLAGLQGEETSSFHTEEPTPKARAKMTSQSIGSSLSTFAVSLSFVVLVACAGNGDDIRVSRAEMGD